MAYSFVGCPDDSPELGALLGDCAWCTGWHFVLSHASCEYSSEHEPLRADKKKTEVVVYEMGLYVFQFKYFTIIKARCISNILLLQTSIVESGRYLFLAGVLSDNQKDFKSIDIDS